MVELDQILHLSNQIFNLGEWFFGWLVSIIKRAQARESFIPSIVHFGYRSLE